jgi:hypothetical protein
LSACQFEVPEGLDNVKNSKPFAGILVIQRHSQCLRILRIETNDDPSLRCVEKFVSLDSVRIDQTGLSKPGPSVANTPLGSSQLAVTGSPK